MDFGLGIDFINKLLDISISEVIGRPQNGLVPLVQFLIHIRVKQSIVKVVFGVQFVEVLDLLLSGGNYDFGLVRSQFRGNDQRRLVVLVWPLQLRIAFSLESQNLFCFHGLLERLNS